MLFPAKGYTLSETDTPGDSMDYLDFLVLGIGCIILFEGARRYDLVSLATTLGKNVSNKEEAGIVDNSISYKILSRPSEGASWSPGIGAAISTRPFVIFILIILTLTVFGAVLTVVTNYSKVGFLIVAIIFALAYHSGPDNVTNEEQYLQVIVIQDPDKMNGHDLRILAQNINSYKSWPFTQIMFGLIFMTSIFWPEAFLFYGLGFILIIGFLYLGMKYSIQKGVFDSAPGI